jgi:hypothetical protein
VYTISKLETTVKLLMSIVSKRIKVCEYEVLYRHQIGNTDKGTTDRSRNTLKFLGVTEIGYPAVTYYKQIQKYETLSNPLSPRGLKFDEGPLTIVEMSSRMKS